MKDIKEVPWELRHEDEIWTIESEGRFVATVENPDYPGNSTICQYIVDMHNAEIDKIENIICHHDFEKMIEALRSGAEA